MAKQWLQQLGLRAYKALARSGLLSNRHGRRLFLKAYGLYKRLLEAGPVDELRRFVPEGSVVVDVGANIGFFTLKFAQWVGPAGQALAIEPDQENFDALTQALARSGVAARVRTFKAVAAERPGSLLLERNEFHPGDHKIALGGAGVAVPAVSVDSLADELAGRPVSLIKIDVQGAEMMVLAGARRTLAKHAPALFVEVDERALAHFGATSHELVSLLEGFGYRMHELARGGAAPPLDRDRLSAELARRGYVDVLFLPDAAMKTAAGQPRDMDRKEDA